MTIRSHRNRLRRATGDESGQTTIEFALILLPLLLVVFLIVEGAIVFRYWIDETHLASSGARYASVGVTPSGSGTTVQQYVRSQMTSTGMKSGGTSRTPSPASICVAFPTTANTVGQPVKVTISTTYHPLSILGISVPVTITGSATQRVENVPSTYSAVVPANCS